MQNPPGPNRSVSVVLPLSSVPLFVTLDKSSSDSIFSHPEDISLIGAMDPETLHDSTVSIDDGDIGESSSYHDQQEDKSSNGGIVRESCSAKELLAQIELDIACSTERLVNLNLLMIHVAARASDLEATPLDNIGKEEPLADSTEKLIEFDFLSGIFDSEVRELDDFIATLQMEILIAREMISSSKHLEKYLTVILERLDDSEKSLKQSQDEVSDLRSQSAKLLGISSSFRSEENLQEDKDSYDLENGSFLHNSAKIKMQTSEHQRHILRMLEKSLATELDLEKKLIESKQMEEGLKSRVHSSALEVLSLEEQATTLLQRLFESDSAAEVLKGISRELMGRLQLCQFCLNGASQREAELNSRIESSESMTSKEKSEIAALRDRIFVLERSADVKCKMLEETNAKLQEELEFMRNNSSPAVIVESLKKQLQEADIQLQNAAASVEASQEKQTMLYSSINDMQTVIDDLKSKVQKAETRADHAEDKWIMVSDSNAELTEELNLLKGSMECLEASTQQAEKAKAATAKDINLRTKVIMDLVMQLAIERERLHKQVSSVMKENRFLVESLQESKKGQSLDISDHVGKSNGLTGVKDGKSSISTEEPQKAARDAWEADIDLKLKTERTIYPEQLGFKHFLFGIFVMAVVGLAVCVFNQESRPF